MNNFQSRIISKIEVEQQALKEHENKSEKIWNEIDKKQNNVLNKLDMLEQNVSNTTENITQILAQYQDLMNQQFLSLVEAQKKVHLQEMNISQLNAQINEMSMSNLHNHEVITAQEQEKTELETFIKKQQKLINQIEANHLKQERVWEEKITLIQPNNSHISQQMRFFKMLNGLCVMIIFLILILFWR